MTLRVLEGEVKRDYYEMQGDPPEAPATRYDQIIKDAMSGPQEAPFYKSLFQGPPPTTVNRNMAVDGSITPVRFNLDVPIGQIYIMTRFVFLIRDGGSFDSGGWGNQVPAAPLPNGMTVGVTIDGLDINFTPIPWTTHADLAGVAYDLAYHDWGGGDNFLVMRLTISKAGTQLRLRGDRGDTFWMDVNDDLRYLTEQRCMCQGKIEGFLLN